MMPIMDRIFWRGDFFDVTLSTDVKTRLERLGNQLRIDSIEETTAAGSGHPTSCMSAADIVAALFFHEMHWDPGDPHVPNRDRFVLSKGHAAPLLYAALHEAGALPGVKLEDLRKSGSPLEGHPMPGSLPWVDVATGSLGQGLSAGLGMALAARLDGENYRVFVLIGDGEAAEGNIWEAMNLASHDKVDNLVAIFDVNELGQSDPTMFGHDMEQYRRRCEAFGWETHVINGHDMGEILRALEETRQRKGRPHAIVARTDKGHGVSFISGKPNWHGKPLPKDEAQKAIAELKEKGAEGNAAGLVQRPERRAAPQPKVGTMEPPPFKPGDSLATREAYGDALVALGKANSEVVALDGDVKNSTYSEKFKKYDPKRFFDCFIAEQNMVTMAAGFSTCGKIPFASTFATFFSRAYDNVRMAAISKANLKLVGSHAGSSIGEDGPSQMALEDIAMFRAIPDGVVLYPSDGTSTWRLVELAAGYKGVVFIRTSRPKTPEIYGPGEKFELGGFKTFDPRGTSKAVVIGAGVTLHEARKAAEQLEKDGVPVTVVDLYCIKPLNAKALSEVVSRAGGRLLVVEDHYAEGGIGDAVLAALATTGTQVRFAHACVRGLPHSAKPEELLHHSGLDAASIVAEVRKLVGQA